ncbi:autotransporter assembly complex protein TamA [Variovorax sp. HJSM1_2]|uniref:autotransporter assembly complex protein TamA n=1 Tax=Variovorax sp. HJSM1_2 TaxID=3366263 RepID=UPI003BE97442
MLRRLLLSLSARWRRPPAPLSSAAPRWAGAFLACSLLVGCAGFPGFGAGDSKADAKETATREEAKDSKQAEAASPPAFTLVVEAPDEIRELLTKHLELQRYSRLTDLSASELSRLLVLAEDNARDLIATLGYFSPSIDIQREAPEALTVTASPADGTAHTPSKVTAPPVVRMKVQAGPQTHIGKVELNFAGDIASNPAPDVAEQQQNIRSNWRLPVGNAFSQADWSSAKTVALRELTARRYLTGKLVNSAADVDPEARQANLSVSFESGPEYRLGQMTATGLSHFPPEMVERFAQLRPGTVYDRDELFKAQQRLTDSGYFDSALMLVDAAGDPQAAPVQTQLREAQLQKLVLGVGISTDSGPRASVEHTHNKVPYIGWRSVSKFTIDKRDQYLGSDVTSLPDEDYWRWLVGGKLQREVDDPLVTSSVQLRAGRLQNTERLDRSLYLQYDRARVTGGDATANTGTNDAFTLSWGWTTRKFDNVVFPTSGWGLGVEIGPGVTIGSQTKPFLRGLLRTQAFFPLSKREGRIALRAQAGAVFADQDAPVPTTQMFLTGGDNTVRGYGYRAIGVTTSTGIVEAGRYMAVGSVEWQRPIHIGGRPSDWESAVFIDSGAVANSLGNLSPQTGVGVGARWHSPIGPLQIDLAYGVEVKDVRLHLSVGFTF